MDRAEALKFAFDWPAVALLPAQCNSCGSFVRKRAVLAHMDQQHPGWLERWNEFLAANGAL